MNFHCFTIKRNTIIHTHIFYAYEVCIPYFSLFPPFFIFSLNFRFHFIFSGHQPHDHGILYHIIPWIHDCWSGSTRVGRLRRGCAQTSYLRKPSKRFSRRIKGTYLSYQFRRAQLIKYRTGSHHLTLWIRSEHLKILSRIRPLKKGDLSSVRFQS